MSGKGSASPRSAAGARNVPTFTLDDLHERIDAVLGKGASGTVYSLKDFPDLAVKEIQIDDLSKSAADAIKLELATLPGISHPGILTYHQVIEDGNTIYIVMDRYDRTLEHFLAECRRKKTPIPNEKILSVTKQVADALTYLSNIKGVDAKGDEFQGLVHRDIKPANILVSIDGEHFVLADFGLCKDALRDGSTFAGTPAYMAPETLINKKTSPASDMWSLGVTMYEMVALKRPDFLNGKKPEEVFVEGWEPDLNAIGDNIARILLKYTLRLNPAERLSAIKLKQLLELYGNSKADTSSLNNRMAKMIADASMELCAIYEIASASGLRDEFSRAMSANNELGNVLSPTNQPEGIPEAMRAKDAEIARLKEEKADLERKINNKKNLHEDIRAAYEQLFAKNNEVKELQEQIASRDASISNLAAEIGNLKQQIGAGKTRSALNAVLARAMLAAQEPAVSAARDHIAGAGARVKMTLSDVSAAPQDALGSLCSALVEESCGTMRALADSRGWDGLPVDSFGPMLGTAVGELCAREFGTLLAQGTLAGVLSEAFGAQLECVPSQGGMLSRGDLFNKQKEVKKNVEAYVDSLKSVSVGGVLMAGAVSDKQITDLKKAVASALRLKHKEIADRLFGEDESVCSPRQGGGSCYWSSNDQGHERRDASGDGPSSNVTTSMPSPRGACDAGGDPAQRAAGDQRHLGIGSICDPSAQHRQENGAASDRGADSAGPIPAPSLVHSSNAEQQRGAPGDAEGAPESVQPATPQLSEGVMFGDLGGFPLMAAVARRDIEAVKQLVRRDVHLTEECPDGVTALMVAAQNDYLEAVKILASRQKGMKDNKGRSALHYALKAGSKEAAEILVPHEGPTDKEGVTALMRAAMGGDVETVKLLALVQACEIDKNGRTAMMYAALNGHVEAVKALIKSERGMATANGSTALICAAIRNQPEVVRVLFEHEKDVSGWTPLMHAAFMGDAKAVKVHNKADRQKVDSSGMTALMYAAASGQAEIAKLLLQEKGMKDNKGWTALMLAANNNHCGVVELLAEHEKDIKNNSKKTALDIAKSKNNTVIVDILSKASQAKRGWFSPNKRGWW